MYIPPPPPIPDSLPPEVVASNTPTGWIIFGIVIVVIFILWLSTRNKKVT